METYIIHMDKALFNLPFTPKDAADIGCLIYVNNGDEKAKDEDAAMFKSHGFHEKQLVNGKYCYFSFEAHKAYEVARLLDLKIKEQPALFCWKLTDKDLKGVDLTWAERHWSDNRVLEPDKKYPYKK